MKKARRLLAVLMAVCMVFALAACGSSSQPAETEAAETEAAAAETEAAAADTEAAVEAVTEAAAEAAAENADGDAPQIGMVVKYANMEFIQALMIGVKNKCAELGYKEPLITDAQADTTKILNAIDNYIAQDIDAFILGGAEDLVSLVPGIEALNEAGIPVMAVDTCPEGGHVDLFITNDIVESSERAAAQMIEGIKEKHNGEVPEGTIIEITGALVDMYTTDCHTGFEKVISQYPQLTVVQGEGNWNNDDSYNRCSDLLTAHEEDCVGIYVHTPDIMGSGVVSAVEAHNLNPADYCISGICIGMEGIELIKQGKLYCVVEQPALQAAEMAVEYIDVMLKGGEIPPVGTKIEEEGALWSPAEFIENTYANSGETLILQAPLVPQEAPADSDQIWENVIEK